MKIIKKLITKERGLKIYNFFIHFYFSVLGFKRFIIVYMNGFNISILYHLGLINSYLIFQNYFYKYFSIENKENSFCVITYQNNSENKSKVVMQKVVNYIGNNIKEFNYKQELPELYNPLIINFNGKKTKISIESKFIIAMNENNEIISYLFLSDMENYLRYYLHTSNKKYEDNEYENNRNNENKRKKYYYNIQTGITIATFFDAILGTRNIKVKEPDYLIGNTNTEINLNNDISSLFLFS